MLRYFGLGGSVVAGSLIRAGALFKRALIMLLNSQSLAKSPTYQLFRLLQRAYIVLKSHMFYKWKNKGKQLISIGFLEKDFHHT